MSLFTRSLWPERVARPCLRLALAILLAPTLLVAGGTAVSFVIAGSSEPTRAGTLAVTTDAGIALAALAALLTVLAVLPGVATLWAMGKRSLLAWSAAGVLFGAGVSVVLGFLQQGAVMPAAVLVGTALCWLIFLLIRALAGVRTR